MKAFWRAAAGVVSWQARQARQRWRAWWAHLTPPLQVTGLLGASGKTYSTPGRRSSLLMCAQPEPESPSPWIHTIVGAIARVPARGRGRARGAGHRIRFYHPSSSSKTPPVRAKEEEEQSSSARQDGRGE